MVTHQVHLGNNNTLTAAEVFLAVKKLKAHKIAGCDEIRPEMFKVLICKVFFG